METRMKTMALAAVIAAVFLLAADSPTWAGKTSWGVGIYLGDPDYYDSGISFGYSYGGYRPYTSLRRPSPGYYSFHRPVSYFIGAADFGYDRRPRRSSRYSWRRRDHRRDDHRRDDHHRDRRW